MYTSDNPALVMPQDGDNVAIAAAPLQAGQSLALPALTCLDAVPAGHKLAIAAIAAGTPIIQQGRSIGLAARDIAAGTRLTRLDVQVGAQPYDPLPAARTLPASTDDATFAGYVRADGSAGTRNFLAVTIVGNCAASAARMVSEHFTAERLAAWPNVDGVVPLIHELGCGMEMTGEFMDLLRRTLSGCIRNPNNAGTVVLALGCERNNIYSFLEQENLASGDTVHTVVLQEVGGTAAAVRQGIEAIEHMLPLANRFQREAVSARHLRVGLLSASIDPFCGVSANPALGAAMDLLVAHGGSVILSDTTDLVALGDDVAPLAASAAVADELRGRADGWRSYQAGRDTRINRQQFGEREASGFLTLREKANAGFARGGHSAIQAVYDYARIIERPGLVFMDSPADEAVCASGQMAAGANLLCLTTGKGSGFGTALVPTLKLASNSQVFQHFDDDLDLNCGVILDGSASIENMGQAIFAALLRHASGEKTCNEVLNVGSTEFAPWPKGVLA